MPIVITSKRNGFRRCGIPHATTPTQYPGDRFTSTQLDILMAEPMLTVQVLPDPDGKDKAPKSGKG